MTRTPTRREPMTDGGTGRLRRLWSALGPTWVAGAIAAGPATMASLVTGGASFGYALLWIVILSAILGAGAQYLATRLGLLTEEGIVAVVERRLGRWWAWVLVADVVLAAGLAQLVIMKTVADVSALITGLDARIWGVTWAVVLALGLAGRGYGFLELAAKLLVSAVVIAFVASLFVVPIEPTGAAAGLVPRIPAGVDGALVAAGILGGGVHITLITMQSYTMRARGWTRRFGEIARLDVVSSMLVAFGLYSVAIYVVAASVLHDPSIAAGDLNAITASQALGPLVGVHAQWLFLAGLWGAAVSTLGGNTIVPPFLLADKLGWDTDVSDGRYRALLAAVALLSAAGAFIEGAFFPLLVLVLAFGLVGTPFAIVVVLVLLNGAVEEPVHPAANLLGLVLVAVTAVTAASFVSSRLDVGLGDPITLFVLVFALVMVIATLALLVKGIRMVRRSTRVGASGPADGRP